MTEYILVSDYNGSLNEAVTKKLKEGWVLYGNPFYAENTATLYQAMVK